MSLFAVAGVTGQTGGATADALLARGHTIRVIVRDAAKAAAWAARGAEVAVADLTDADALTQALTGVDGAFLLNPPAYGSADPFGDAATVANSMALAVKRSGIGRVVVLSSIGGHLPEGTGMIGTAFVLEKAFADIDAKVTFLRAPYLMENLLSVVPLVKDNGILPTLMLSDLVMDMAPVRDVGAAAADILTGIVAAAPVLELHGQAPVNLRKVADAFAEIRGASVQVIDVPRAGWADVVASWGIHPAAQAHVIAMYDGINNGTVQWQHTTSIAARTRVIDWARDVLA